jgi:hypothetical protein
MDVASLVLGIPSLIVLIVKAYQQVQVAVDAYRNMDANFSKIVLKIGCEQQMFGVIVERLLFDIVDEDRRRGLKRGQVPGDDALHRDVVSGLGDLASPVRDYMEHAHDTLREISAILSELNPPSKHVSAHAASPIRLLALRTVGGSPLYSIDIKLILDSSISPSRASQARPSPSAIHPPARS